MPRRGNVQPLYALTVYQTSEALPPIARRKGGARPSFRESSSGCHRIEGELLQLCSTTSLSLLEFASMTTLQERQSTNSLSLSTFTPACLLLDCRR